MLRKQLATLVPELLAAEPTALAVLLFGSHARGGAGPFSDIDLRVFTAAAPRQRDRVRITVSEGRLIHWSIGARSVAEKLEELATLDQWPWAAAHYRDMQPLHDPRDILGLMRAAVERARPEPVTYATTGYDLETLMEYLAKLKNAVLAGSDREAFAAAVQVAHFCEKLLRPLNPIGIFASEAEMDEYFRWLPVAPQCWSDDRDRCMAASGAARTPSEVLAAARRMALGTVELVSAAAERLPLPEDVGGYLRDGTIRAYLAREV